VRDTAESDASPANDSPRLRVVLDARLRDGVNGGVQQWVIGLASALARLDDGAEDYAFLTTEGEDDWLRPYVSSGARFLPFPAPAPPAARSPTAEKPVAQRPVARPSFLRSLARRVLRVLALVPRTAPAPKAPHPASERPGAGPQRDHLGVRAGILAQLALVVARPDHLAVVHQHGPDGHVVVVGRALGLVQREAHEVLVAVGHRGKLVSSGTFRGLS